MATRCSEATPPGAHRLDKAGRWGDDDDYELDVFAAERYFNGDDDALLWCARSSSSFSSAFRTGTYEHDRTATVATSSSEASWNSRSVLLPDDGKVLAVAATAPPSVEAEFRETAGRSERPREKPSPPSPHLRRWLLGVAGCACIGCDGHESDSPDDIGGDQKHTDGAGELFQITERKQLPMEATSVKARPGRWLDDGGDFVVGVVAAFSPSQVAEDGHRHALKSGEFSTPIFNTATTAALVHERQDSAFAIVAGNTASGGVLHAAVTGEGRSATPGRPAGTGRCDPSEEGDSAPSEIGCAYPPSEASVAWSVVTAEGAASCKLSSAASGYHYLNGALRHAAGRSNRRRRGGVTNSGGLLTCMGDKAVDAVGPAGPPWSAGQ